MNGLVNAVLYMISPAPPYSYTTATLQWSDGTLVRAERILPIPGNPMDFWFVDFTNNRLLKIDQFPEALKGAILLITELPNTVYYNGDYHTTHFWTLRYSGGALQLEPLLVTHNGTELSTQIEGAAFVPH
jgi:hypothetical protein